MTEEEKQLLIKDLSARLSYGVVCHYNCVIPCERTTIVKTNARDILKGIIPMSDGHIGFMIGIDKVNAFEGDIKPYLRSLSSMTKEEREEMVKLHIDDRITSNIEICDANCVDFYNSHHLDYRGLIPMGLALEAPEGMYK